MTETEQHILAALRALDILDTEPETDFDALTRLADSFAQGIRTRLAARQLLAR